MHNFSTTPPFCTYGFMEEEEDSNVRLASYYMMDSKSNQSAVTIVACFLASSVLRKSLEFKQRMNNFWVCSSNDDYNFDIQRGF